ncbi:MAG: DUF6088 family protein [Proteobacteria bacterium]|nr:DUF6088 family protein [Pseudomonadota bacterium]
MQAIDNKIISRIYGRGRGWVFTKIDFVAEFGEDNIHQSLSSLAKSGRIRRVCRGVYDYPRYSDLLEQELSPDMDQVAQALARKFNWRIFPSGDIALNLLGLSTQVPARWVYLSDGPSREYRIDKQLLSFKESALKDLGFSLRESGLLVQALKALGKENVDQKVIESLRKRLDGKNCARILKDTRTVTGWIYKIIKQICKECE